MSTPTEAAISELEQILDLESISLVRYIIETSKPPLVKAEDHKALACFQDLYRESERGIVAMHRLLSRYEVPALRVVWPLNYTSYNFLRPVYLLQPLVRHLESHFAALERHQARLAATGWDEATDLTADLLAREKEHLVRIRKLAEEHAVREAAAPVIKGTSASRW